MRRASRVDRNQSELVEAMRHLGFVFEHTHALGGGVPDGVAGIYGRMVWVEFKAGHAGLTQEEERWHAGWNAVGRPVEIVRDITDVLELRQRISREAFG